jgi:hypothetical protein
MKAHRRNRSGRTAEPAPNKQIKTLKDHLIDLFAAIDREEEVVPYKRTGKQTPKKQINNVTDLIGLLAAIDRDEVVAPYNDTGAAFDQASADRQAAIAALSAVEDFLRSQGFISAVLYQLKLDLKTVEFGSGTPAIFILARTAGRKADAKVVQGLKGRFAGMACIKMQEGLSREQAARWVARSIPDALARRVSTKPIRPSTVKEWMGQYGCSAAIRRLLRSAGAWEKFQPKLEEEIRSKHIEGSYGELECLRMMSLGQDCLAAEEPVPFQELIDFFQQKFIMEILADV